MPLGSKVIVVAEKDLPELLLLERRFYQMLSIGLQTLPPELPILLQLHLLIDDLTTPTGCFPI
jgi:hypothetical protein